jgi:hypothetical protein
MIRFPLYFNHVPKCAGTSLNEVLSRNLHRSELGIEPFTQALHVYNLDGAALDRLMVVGSHFPHWAAARRLPDWCRMTVLREPWSRFQALSRHLMRIATSEPQSLPVTQAHYVGLLREHRYRDALRHALAWYPFDASMTSFFLSDPLEGAPPRDAREAIDNMGRYDLVLMSDRVDADSVLLDEALNGQSFGAMSRLNTSREYRDKETGPYVDHYRGLFHALFPYERELFDAGAEAYARTSAALKKQVAQRSGGPESVPNRRSSAMYALDWDAPVRCGGFSDRLRVQSFGYAGRFARRVEAPKAVLEFDVPVSSDARVEAVFWCAPFDLRFHCKLRLNGAELRMFDTPYEVRCPSDPSQLWAYASVPASTLKAGRCRLEIDRSEAQGLVELWLLDLIVRPDAAARR